MDKINKEIIEAKLRLHEIEEEKKNLDEEYQLLQDKIHLYFDSPNMDTAEAEEFIISYFWQNAYKNLKDGGYVTNNEFVRTLRFPYECKLLEKIINENCSNRQTAIDVGCGSGDLSRFFASFFDDVLGVDMSNDVINKNNIENKIKNLRYENSNAFGLDESKKFDFVFASDMFMYTPKKNISKMFLKLLNLLNKNGILLVRESTKDIGYEDHKSKNYVAYYRNCDFYEKGIFENNFIAKYKNYGYSMYFLHKYFSVNPEMKETIRINPMLLETIVPNHVSEFEKTGYFYVFSKK